MLVLVDTNVWLRLIEPKHPRHADAAGSLRFLRASGRQPCLVPQIHYEFWVVATRPIGLNGLGMTIEEAEEELRRLGPPLFRFLRDERAIYDRWRELVAEQQVEGKQAHDARLVAAMKRHGVTDLLTFNVNDFKRYRWINLLEPGTVEPKPSS